MWRRSTGTTKFSIVAFVLTMALGLLSMGALGYGLYFLVAPVLDKDIDTIPGDATQPIMLMVGILSSFGFLFGALAFHYLRYRIGELLSYLVYVILMWLWVLLLWYVFLNYAIIQ